MRGERYLALDGLRGIAAIAVVLMHSQIGALHGYLAVDLFFIMSGFVIARSYEGGLASGELGFGQYVRVRLERLYPMIFLGGVVGVLFYLAGLSEFEPADRTELTLGLASQFLLIPCLTSVAVYFPLNNPQWSVLWELGANFVHAAGLARVRNGVLVAIVLLCIPGLAFVAFRLGNLGRGCSGDDFLAALPRVGFGFFAGVLLYRTRGTWLKRVPAVSFTWPVGAFLVLVSMPPFLVPIGPWFAVYDVAVVTLLFVPLVMLTVKAQAGPVASALGALSYPLYTLSEPATLAAVSAGASVPVKFAIVMGLIGLAWVAGKYIDEPLNVRRRNIRQAKMTRMPDPLNAPAAA